MGQCRHAAFGNAPGGHSWPEMGGKLQSAVIPAKAGTQSGRRCTKRLWAPAFAGVTDRGKMGSIAERQEFSASEAKPPYRFWDRGSAPLMAAYGWIPAIAPTSSADKIA